MTTYEFLELDSNQMNHYLLIIVVKNAILSVSVFLLLRVQSVSNYTNFIVHSHDNNDQRLP